MPRPLRVTSLPIVVLLLGLAACGGGGGDPEVIAPPAPPAPRALTLAVAGDGSGTVVSEPAAINCVIDRGVTAGACSASFAPSTAVTLRATAGALSTFVGWQGACAGAEACSVTLSEARSVTAAFRRIPPQALTISSGGTGGGTVVSDPAGVTCTIDRGVARGTCSATFEPGTVVTLGGTADALSDFGGWGGACTGAEPCRVTLAQAGSVTATFEQRPPQRVSVSAAGLGDGTVTSEPAGIACTVAAGATSGTCEATFEVGTALALRATPASLYEFVGWAGACTGGAACQLTATTSRAVSASFQRRAPQQVAVRPAGKGSGTITSEPAGITCAVDGGVASGTCSAAFDVGATVTLRAAAASALSEFTGWSGACSGGAACEVLPTEARAVTAAFAGPTIRVDAANFAPNTTPGLGNATITLDPGGITCVVVDNALTTPCQTELPPGAAFTAKVFPAAGEAGVVVFTPPVGTTGSVCGGATPSAPFACTAVPTVRASTLRFQLFRRYVGIIRFGPAISTGLGRITSDVGGINCRITPQTSSGMCGAELGPIGADQVVLTFTPDDGTTFNNWAGDCGLVTTPSCTLTLPPAKRQVYVNSTAAPATP